MSDGTFVYVHGTGDRVEEADDHARLIEERITDAGRDFRVVAVQWGRDAGSDLGRIHLALPRSDRDPSDEASTDLDLLALRDDPLTGLAELARPTQAPDLPPADVAALNVSLADQLLAAAGTGAIRPSELATSEAVGRTPAEISLAVRDAAARVATSEAYRDAREVGSAELDAAVVRAVAAAAANELLPASIPDDVWKAVAWLLEQRLGGGVVDVLAIGAVLAFYGKKDVPPSLGRWATDRLRPRRRPVMESLLGITDILLYQRHGDEIRDVVGRAIENAARDSAPVIALGNSLGGIILVDLLSEAGALPVNLLVTTGSQAPALATFGALGRAAMAKPFQPWLNIYDPRDFVAFVAEDVWPAETGIVDHEVNLDIGFPHAHGGTYFSRPDVFPKHLDIFDRLPPR